MTPEERAMWNALELPRREAEVGDLLFGDRAPYRIYLCAERVMREEILGTPWNTSKEESHTNLFEQFDQSRIAVASSFQASIEICKEISVCLDTESFDLEKLPDKTCFLSLQIARAEEDDPRLEIIEDIVTLKKWPPGSKDEMMRLFHQIRRSLGATQ